MGGYVYIRYNKQEWGRVRRLLEINGGLDGLIECVAIKYYNDKKYIGRAKRMIIKAANNLLDLKKIEERLSDNDLIVYHRASLNQLANLRRPKNGYTSCYAVIILMAIVNLLCDGCETNITTKAKSLCDEKIHFLKFALREQYDDLLAAYNRSQGEFGNIDSHQYKLVRYYNASCLLFNKKFEDPTYDYVVTHLDPKHIYNYQESIPNYREFEFVEQ